MSLLRLSRPISRSIVSRSVLAATVSAPASTDTPRSSRPPRPPPSSPALSSVLDAWRNSGAPLRGASSAQIGFIDARRSSGRPLPKASAPVYMLAVDTQRRSGPSPRTRGFIAGTAVDHWLGPLSLSTTTRGFSSSPPQGPVEDSTQSSADPPSEHFCSLPEDSTGDSSKQTTETTEDTHELSASQKRFLKRNLKHMLRPSWRPPTHDPLLDPLQLLKLSQYAKMVEGVTYDECVDESNLFLNFDPLTYAKTIPMMFADLVPGSSSKDLFWAVTDAAKILIRSLLTILVSFHKMGWCFRILNLQSVVITGEGKFKLRAAHMELVPWTPEGVDADYNSTSEIVKTLLIASCGQEIFAKITRDFKDLFRVMRTGSKYEYLIYTHVALLPLSSWETVYMKLYTEVTKVLKKDDGLTYIYVLSKVSRVDWAALAQSNSILKQFYPRKQTMTAIYNDKKQNEIEFQLDLIRNAIAHKKDSNPYRDVVFTFMLYALFPSLLSSIQEALFHVGRHHLGHLRIEENFNEGKLHLTDFLPKAYADSAPGTEGMLTLEDKIAMLHATAASSKEGIDGSELFVGGLSFGMNEQDFRDAFAPYGSIIEASICLDNESGKSKGFGFVTYTTMEEASAAITAMNGTMLAGRRIRVSHADNNLFSDDTGAAAGGRGGT